MRVERTESSPPLDPEDADLIASYVAEGCAVPTKGTPFANGFEGDHWTANWCDRCLVDAPFRNGLTARGCRLIELSLIGWTPGEWLEQGPNEEGLISLANQYHCMKYKGHGRRDPEPHPTPPPPGQDDLFDPEPMRGPKVLTSEPIKVGVLV